MLEITPQERLALGVVTLLLVAGGWARVVAGNRPGATWVEEHPSAADTGSIGAPALRAAVQSEVEREAVRSKPLAPGERIDPNGATADELDRLPRVGPALARRLVEHREVHGPYRTLADVDAVPGVGPALLARLAPHLELRAAPASAPMPVPAPVPGAAQGPLDVNRASAAELEALPGVGPVLAARIVAWRRDHGPVRDLNELEGIPGIGPALLQRITPRLRVR